MIMIMNFLMVMRKIIMLMRINDDFIDYDNVKFLNFPQFKLE